jgi:hypothetical protein
VKVDLAKAVPGNCCCLVSQLGAAWCLGLLLHARKGCYDCWLHHDGLLGSRRNQQRRAHQWHLGNTNTTQRVYATSSSAVWLLLAQTIELHACIIRFQLTCGGCVVCGGQLQHMTMAYLGACHPSGKFPAGRYTLVKCGMHTCVLTGVLHVDAETCTKTFLHTLTSCLYDDPSSRLQARPELAVQFVLYGMHACTLQSRSLHLPHAYMCHAHAYLHFAYPYHTQVCLYPTHVNTHTRVMRKAWLCGAHAYVPAHTRCTHTSALRAKPCLGSQYAMACLYSVAGLAVLQSGHSGLAVVASADACVHDIDCTCLLLPNSERPRLCIKLAAKVATSSSG